MQTADRAEGVRGGGGGSGAVIQMASQAQPSASYLTQSYSSVVDGWEMGEESQTVHEHIVSKQ